MLLLPSCFSHLIALQVKYEQSCIRIRSALMFISMISILKGLVTDSLYIFFPEPTFIRCEHIAHIAPMTRHQRPISHHTFLRQLFEYYSFFGFLIINVYWKYRMADTLILLLEMSHSKYTNPDKHGHYLRH